MKNKSIKTLILAGLAFAGSFSASAQLNVNDLSGQQRALTTTVPFLIITPDARSGAMGDAGVAISPDANTIHWNPAKLAFMPNEMGFSLTYTPWLKQLVPDISLSYLSGYYKIDELSGFGASLRYFSLGDITFTNEFGDYIKTFRPYEFAADAAYARKLSKNFSIGIAGRFIHSNLAGQTTLQSGASTKPAYTFAGDVSGYYTKPLKLGGNEGKNATLSFGGNISNMGGKITYTDAADRDFIPINMRLGSYMNIEIDEFNQIGFALDFNKLLVPTAPVYQMEKDTNGNPTNNIARDPNTGKPVIERGQDPNVPVITGMVQSFYDAPDGFAEELKEINPSIGIEYWYSKMIAGRAGYFYEHRDKGNRQYLTLGLGLRYNVLGLDFSYLIPTNTTNSIMRSPLENTLRFSLLFNLNPKKNNDNINNL